MIRRRDGAYAVEKIEFDADVITLATRDDCFVL